MHDTSILHRFWRWLSALVLALLGRPRAVRVAGPGAGGYPSTDPTAFALAALSAGGYRPGIDDGDVREACRLLLRAGRYREASALALYLRDATMLVAVSDETCDLARLALLQAKPRDAARLFESADQPAHAALLLESLDEHAAARDLWECCRRSPAVAASDYLAGLAEINLGRMAARCGDPDAARAHFRDAVALLERVAAAPPEAPSESLHDALQALWIVGRESRSYALQRRGLERLIEQLTARGEVRSALHHRIELEYTALRFSDLEGAARDALAGAALAVAAGLDVAPWQARAATHFAALAEQDARSARWPEARAARGEEARALERAGSPRRAARAWRARAEMPGGTDDDRAHDAATARALEFLPERQVGLIDYGLLAPCEPLAVHLLDLRAAERGGDVDATACDLLLDPAQSFDTRRRAAHVLLLARMEPAADAARHTRALVAALCGVEHYEVLPALRDLFARGTPETRIAVLHGVRALVHLAPAFGLLAQGLASGVEAERAAALDTLKVVVHPRGFWPLRAMHRAESDPPTRAMLLAAIARIETDAAQDYVVDAALHGPQAERLAALQLLMQDRYGSSRRLRERALERVRKAIDKGSPSGV